MQVYPNRLNAQLQNAFSSFYLVFGDEPQQKLQALSEIRTHAKQQGFDERSTLAVDSQFSWSQVLELTQSLSLFSSKTYIELEIPEGKPGTEGSKLLIELAEQANPDILLVLHGGKIGKDVQNTKWFKRLDANGVYIPCYPLEGKALTQWVGQQLAAAGLNNQHDNCQSLIDSCEGNLLAAKQEIEKLALLYPDGNLTPEQIQHAVVDQSRFNVFQLVDVLLSGDGQRSVKMLYRLESEGVEPNIILWALVREWQVLQQLRYLQQQQQAINWNQFRIWSNRQGLYMSALRRINNEQLTQMQHKLSAMDMQLKQSSVARPYVELCHLCMLFLGYELTPMELA